MPALGKKLQDDLTAQWFMDSLVKQLQQVIPLKFQIMEIKFAPLQTVHLSRTFKLLPTRRGFPCSHILLSLANRFQSNRARGDEKAKQCINMKSRQAFNIEGGDWSDWYEKKSLESSEYYQGRCWDDVFLPHSLHLFAV